MADPQFQMLLAEISVFALAVITYFANANKK